MTTGITGVPNPAGASIPNDMRAYRNWSGGDGKIEYYASFARLKWNPFTAEASSYLCSQELFYLGWQNKNPPYNSGVDPYSGSISLRPTFNEVPVSDATRTKMLQRLLQEIKGHSFNLGVETGQLHQTVDLLSGNLRKLGLSAMALKHGDFAGAARQLGARPRGTRLKPSDISGRWLELQYGWLPLLSSSFEAAKAFEAISNGPRSSTIVVSASTKVIWETSLSPSQWTAKLNGKVGTRLQYEMYEEMSVPRQLGLYNPLSIAWELTPWSFVIDWFYPIGTYLDNLNQIPFLKGRFLTTDFLRFGRQKLAFTFLAHPFWVGYNSWTVGVPQVTASETRVLRTFSSSPPKVPLPTFKFGLNSSRRFWNAVSLGQQRFGGKIPVKGIPRIFRI